MGFLDDDSIDPRARAILVANRTAATVDLFRRAALVEDAPSPAMLEDTALWLRVVDAFRNAGFTTREVLLGCTRCALHTRQRHSSTPGLLAHVLAADDGLELARAICEELLPRAGRLAYREQLLANTVLARLGAVEPRFEPLFAWHPTTPSQIRAIFAGLSAERREALALSRVHLDGGDDNYTASNASFILGKLLDLAELAATPSLLALRRDLLALAKAEGNANVDALEAELAAGAPRVIGQRPTPIAASALAYWLGKTATAMEATDITVLAQTTHARKVAVDAPELATVAGWIAAGTKRQKQIALGVAKALDAHTKLPAKLVDITTFGGPPIAVIECGKLRMCLVPGGAFEMGFSEEEEAAVRAEAEVRAGCDNHYELYEQLFDQVDRMRPITHVRVGPMLVAQAPGTVCSLANATTVLRDSPFRMPSEAEWEYLARGGKPRELTYRGDVVPDDESWFEETKKLGVKGANAFGLWGFGYQPELCADVYAETLDDVPSNGSPRRGDGERVVRGGAAQLYPWQSTGEWHMLLSAFRMPQSAWEFTLALRFVLGIECGAKRS